MIDQVISAGRYRVGRLVGRGGMAHVRLGLDVQTGRAVAVKYLLDELLHDQDARRLFQAEALTASLDHPSVVRVLDSGHAKDADTGVSVPYLVMDFVPGKTLRALLREGTVDLDTALDLAVQLLGALAYCHSVGIVHRDVKPGNVMVTPAGRVRLVDFGVARHPGDASEPSDEISRFVSNAYASPEQVQRLPADARSDVYSVGCVLYEALTGRPPFAGEGTEVLIERLFEDPVPPSEHNPDIDSDLDAVLLRSLRRYPGERYPSAEAMTDDLDDIIRSRRARAVLAPVDPADTSPTDESTGWATVTVLRPARRPPRRRMVSVISGAAAALLPIAGFGAFHLRGAELADGGAVAASLIGGSRSPIMERTTVAGPSAPPGSDIRPGAAFLLSSVAGATSFTSAEGLTRAKGAGAPITPMPDDSEPEPESVASAPETLTPEPTQPQPSDPEPKPSAPKPSVPKPSVPKPGEPKPGEPKPSAPKPSVPKPGEPKPDKPKPSEPKPDKPKPSEPKPDKPKPSEPKPDKPKPSESKPDKPKPSESKPDKPKPSESKPDKPEKSKRDKPDPKDSTVG
ncbi:protein kinase domain-containing protein [Microlunatus aurantiacus]